MDLKTGGWGNEGEEITVEEREKGKVSEGWEWIRLEGWKAWKEEWSEGEGGREGRKVRGQRLGFVSEWKSTRQEWLRFSLPSLSLIFLFSGAFPSYLHHVSYLYRGNDSGIEHWQWGHEGLVARQVSHLCAITIRKTPIRLPGAGDVTVMVSRHENTTNHGSRELWWRHWDCAGTNRHAAGENVRAVGWWATLVTSKTEHQSLRGSVVTSRRCYRPSRLKYYRFFIF